MVDRMKAVMSEPIDIIALTVHHYHFHFSRQAAHGREGKDVLPDGA